MPEIERRRVDQGPFRAPVPAIRAGTLAADILSELRALGVTLAIDDFGTGYSSLAYLRSFPVAVLKVDRSFVRDMLTEPRNANLVKAVVQMAHSLGLSVTAEGIETQAQRDSLLALGANTGQGYGLGRPMPAPALFERCERAPLDQDLALAG